MQIRQADGTDRRPIRPDFPRGVEDGLNRLVIGQLGVIMLDTICIIWHLLEGNDRSAALKRIPSKLNYNFWYITNIQMLSANMTVSFSIDRVELV